ncbi:MAG: tyrosine-type recombinase/integrase [Candidatus Sulfotelmatobacter sp.]
MTIINDPASSAEARPMQIPKTVDWRACFIEYLAAERGYSEHTIKAYEADLEQFSEGLGKELLSASVDDIRQFISNRLEQGAGPKTARRELSVIKSFYRFAFGEGAIDHNPSRHIRAPKAFELIVRPIIRPEFERILASISAERPIDLRNRAIVFALYGSGFRVSEIITLKIADVDFRHSVTKVRLGKGRKDRLVPMSSPEIEAFQVYLKRARPHLSKDPDDGVMFIGKRGKPLTRQRVWQLLTEISERIIGRGISPHKYRHAFVTDTINGGASYRVVQAMAGHASVSTTMRYMHSDLERTRIEYLKSHPRGV